MFLRADFSLSRAHPPGALQAWSPPELPGGITEAVRAVLHAEGMNPAGGWDNLTDPDMRPEEFLLWPEGVPALMSDKTP